MNAACLHGSKGSAIANFLSTKALWNINIRKVLCRPVSISHTYVERNRDKRLTSVFQGSKCSIIFVKQGSRSMAKSDQPGETPLIPRLYLLPLPRMYSNCCLAHCKQAAPCQFQVSPLVCQLAYGQNSARGSMVEPLKHGVKRFECYLPSLGSFLPHVLKRGVGEKGKEL